jgi:hypothetical protein
MVERSCTLRVLASLASIPTYEKTFTARAMTSPTTTRKTIDCRAIESFAQHSQA